MTTDDQKMPKNAEKFECKLCYFVCSKKSNFTKHQTTRKHIKNVELMTTDDKKMPKMPKNLNVHVVKHIHFAKVYGNINRNVIIF